MGILWKYIGNNNDWIYTVYVSWEKRRLSKGESERVGARASECAHVRVCENVCVRVYVYVREHYMLVVSVSA